MAELKIKSMKYYSVYYSRNYANPKLKSEGYLLVTAKDESEARKKFIKAKGQQAGAAITKIELSTGFYI